jgi:hypothetical protein
MSRARAAGIVSFAVLALVTRVARPAEPAMDDATAYCEWVGGVADSASALLLAPSVFGSLGVVNGYDAQVGAASTPPTTRLIAGMTYSFTGLYRGIAMRSQSDAECRRYKAVSQLHAFLETNKDAESRRALKAKLDALVEALPRGEAIVRALRDALQAGHATVEEVDAAQLRLDGLRQLAAETRTSFDALGRLPPAPREPIATVLAERDAAEAETERYDARIRESYGWDLSIRGGYDRLFGVRDYTPLFAGATLTVDLGWFFQYGADARAAAGRREWVRKQIEGVDDRVEQALTRLRAVRASEAARLKETAILLADLEARYKAVSAVSGEKARGYADYVWFDLARVRADQRFLTAHLEELDAMLREAPK